MSRRTCLYMLLIIMLVSFFPMTGKANSLKTNQENPAQKILKENRRWGRDPFYRERPRVNNKQGYPSEMEIQETKEEIDFLLSAIIFKDGNGVAIINDRIVRRGDSLGDGVVVKRILSNKVVLREGKRTVVLRVQPFRSE